MERVTCAFCRLPFAVRRREEGVDYFCCSGCALASRIPMEQGQLPVSRGLVIALALGFGLFNQTLFAVLGAAVAAEGRAEVGAVLLIISLAVGGALLIACLGFLGTAQQRRRSDVIAALPALALAGATVIAFTQKHGASAPGLLLAANAWLACWLSRGWLRRAWAQRTCAAAGGEAPRR